MAGYYRTIKGVKYDRALLEEAEALATDGTISFSAAKKLWASACDGRGVTDIEKQTLSYVFKMYTYDKKAKTFFKLSTEMVGDASKAYYKIVDGVKYDRSLLKEALAEVAACKGTLDHDAVLRLWASAADDGPGVTEIEARTLQAVCDAYPLSSEASKCLVERLATTAFAQPEHNAADSEVQAANEAAAFVPTPLAFAQPEHNAAASEVQAANGAAAVVPTPLAFAQLEHNAAGSEVEAANGAAAFVPTPLAFAQPEHDAAASEVQAANGAAAIVPTPLASAQPEHNAAASEVQAANGAAAFVPTPLAFAQPEHNAAASEVQAANGAAAFVPTPLRLTDKVEEPAATGAGLGGADAEMGESAAAEVGPSAVHTEGQPAAKQDSADAKVAFTLGADEPAAEQDTADASAASPVQEEKPAAGQDSTGAKAVPPAQETPAAVPVAPKVVPPMYTVAMPSKQTPAAQQVVPAAARATTFQAKRFSTDGDCPMMPKRFRTSEGSDPVGSLASCQKMLAAVCAQPLTEGFKSIGTIGTNLEKIEQRVKGAILSLEAQVYEHSAMLDSYQTKELTLEGNHKSAQEHTAARGLDVGDAKNRLNESIAAKRAALSGLQRAEGLLAVAEHQKRVYEDLYQLHFLPLMKGEFTGREANEHIDAVRTALQRWGIDDCLLAGFVESARHPPSERRDFCARVMTGVDNFFQQPLQDVGVKCNSAKEVVEASLCDLRAAEAHVAECEAVHKKSLDDHQGAKDNEGRILAELNGTRKDKTALILLHEETRRKLDAQKLQLDAFHKLCCKIAELARLCCELEIKLVDAKQGHASIEQRMADISLQQYKDVTAMKSELVARAQKALDLAIKERMIVQQNVATAEGKARHAESEKSYRADLYNNRFLVLLNGKFSNVMEASSHLRVLMPVLQKWEMEVCLLAAFGEAGKKYPADRRDWCVQTMQTVGDFFQHPMQDADSKWIISKEKLAICRHDLIAADEAVARAEAELKRAMDELQIARRAEEEAMKLLTAIQTELRVAITLVKDITFQLQAQLKHMAVYGDRLEVVGTQGGDWVSVLHI